MSRVRFPPGLSKLAGCDAARLRTSGSVEEHVMFRDRLFPSRKFLMDTAWLNRRWKGGEGRWRN